VALAILVAAIFTPGVLAHATLVRSEPAANVVLAEPPRQVRLWFSEPISPQFSTAKVLDVNGQPVELSGIRADPAEPARLILDLPDLPPGVYSVLWKVLSETDGHFTQGLLVFGVGEGADLGSAVAAETETAIPPLEVFLRWLNFSLLAGLAGAVAVVYLVLAPAGHSPAVEHPIASARRRVLRWAVGCGGLSLLVGVGLWLWQVATLMGTLPEGVSVLAVGWQLLRTRWGMLWLARQGILVAVTGIVFLLLNPRSAIPGTLWVPRSAMAAVVAGLLLPALMLVQTLIGHTAAVTPNTVLAVVVDVLHLSAAGLWVGGLLALVVGLLPLIRSSRADFAGLVRAGWGPFSRLAAVSVVLLVATGLYSAGRQVASVDALITTLYGQVLLGKIGLVLAVGAIGLLNSMLLHPRLAAPLARLLRRPSGWTPLPLARLPALVLVEAGLGLMVFLATGLITAAPPPRGLEFTVAPEIIPSSLSESVDDLVVTFSARPNRPGQNVFHVFAASSRRPPLAEIMRVILRFTYLNQDLGRVSAVAEEVEPGRYLLGGNYLSLAGPWQVEVVVRRRGIEDSVARFNWVVAPPGSSHPVVISRRPLEPLLTVAAAVMILVLLVVMALRVGLAQRWLPGRWPGGLRRAGLSIEHFRPD
jgi:copper transport protein